MFNFNVKFSIILIGFIVYGIYVCIIFCELFNFNKIYGILKNLIFVLIKYWLCILKYIKDVI